MALDTPVRFGTVGMFPAHVAKLYLAYLYMLHCSASTTDPAKAPCEAILADWLGGKPTVSDTKYVKTAKRLGLVKDDGSFTVEALTFRDEVLLAEGARTPALLSTVVTNMLGASSSLIAYMRIEMLTLGKYPVHAELLDECAAYAVNQPDVLARLIIEAHRRKWSLTSKIANWVGYDATIGSLDLLERGMRAIAMREIKA